MIKYFILLTMGAWLFTSQAIAHTFFVGSSEISINKNTNSIEVVHRFTSHDVQNMITDLNRKRVETDSKEYLKMVQNYVESGFTLRKPNGEALPLVLVGIDPGINETFIYQEVLGVTNIKDLTIFHQLLTDYFPNQKNRINYQSDEVKGSLLFDNRVNELILK